jgi:hypothetical protein
LIALAFVASAAGVWLIATIMTGLIALLRTSPRRRAYPDPSSRSRHRRPPQTAR